MDEEFKDRLGVSAVLLLIALILKLCGVLEISWLAYSMLIICPIVLFLIRALYDYIKDKINDGRNRNSI